MDMDMFPSICCPISSRGLLRHDLAEKERKVLKEDSEYLRQTMQRQHVGERKFECKLNNTKQLVHEARRGEEPTAKWSCPKLASPEVQLSSLL